MENPKTNIYTVVRKLAKWLIIPRFTPPNLCVKLEPYIWAIDYASPTPSLFLQGGERPCYSLGPLAQQMQFRAVQGTNPCNLLCIVVEVPSCKSPRSEAKGYIVSPDCHYSAQKQHTDCRKGYLWWTPRFEIRSRKTRGNAD